MKAQDAVDALDLCDEALARLAGQCCEPGRSPRMVRLAETLKQARGRLTSSETASDAAQVVATLSDAGAQLGGLQVECCAPSRMPLYAEMLGQLMASHRAVTKAYGLGH